MKPNRRTRWFALLRQEPRLLQGLSWRTIGYTVLAGVVLTLPTEPLWQAPSRHGVPLGTIAWLRASWPWFAFTVLTGLNIVLLAAVLSNLWRSRRGIGASLAIAVIAGTALSCAIFAAQGDLRHAGSNIGYELRAGLWWGLAAATYYAVAHARLIPWKGVALVFVFALLNGIRGQALNIYTEPQYEFVLPIFESGLTNLAAALPIVMCVVAALNRFPVRGQRQFWALALAVILGTGAGVSILLGIAPLDYDYPSTLAGTLIIFRGLFARFGVPGALFAAVYAYYRNELRDAAQLRRAEIDQARLDAQMSEARLQVLQAQIEPHFLFNTLAHVKRLYQTDPHVASGMLANLMRYLTVALPQMRADESTVERETALAEAYLNVQRIRMGRRLDFDISVPESLLGARLPPMMLLTLVENAVKHGLGPLPEGGFIRIEAGTNTGVLEVRVADTGRGFTATAGTGMGIANLRARLTGMYGSRGRLSITPNAPRGVTASIAVPLAIAPAQTEPQ